ncbi:response regulator transcription factor [Sedimentitalea sp. JM2-8]|uniref:Response regulator transcription factor n=1 Tax=Sedimentitalea xiamensis TaxID=3050037 RepID=A0ABT7FET5_9RHOB|nr:response regulator transcription factor [Sedimentitalea xiamensis]MDK3073490.1 response regulator transcription factor [Sedimentitalea xiamensis]
MGKGDDVLVVDDDPGARALLRRCLSEDGFRVREAETEEQALAIAADSDLGLITLDIHLEGGSGFDMARKLRGLTPAPIIIVSAGDDVVDRIVGLELGADDYITKPFHTRELMARVHCILRRAQRPSAAPGPAAARDGPGCTVLRFDGMAAIPDQFELFDRNGKLCDLTTGDFKLLNAFLRHPRRILSRERLMDLVGGQTWTPLDRTIDNQVARLRKKIEKNPHSPRLIKTVRGVGYLLACSVEWDEETDAEAG